MNMASPYEAKRDETRGGYYYPRRTYKGQRHKRKGENGAVSRTGSGSYFQ